MSVSEKVSPHHLENEESPPRGETDFVVDPVPGCENSTFFRAVVKSSH